jgi:UDP-perosamine 4-acetyltransferase
MDVIIIGAGGHGKVVLDILRHSRRVRVAGFLDADESLAGARVAGVKVLGPVNLLAKLRRKKIKTAVVAIGDNRTRAQYMNEVRAAGFTLLNAIHPKSVVSRSAKLGENVVIAAGAVVCAEADIGDGAIINTAAVVDHECRVGPAAHICPTAALAGRVTVDEGAFVGLGAKIIQCLSIGAWSTIGAGAVVITDIPAGERAVGVPARAI